MTSAAASPKSTPATHDAVPDVPNLVVKHRGLLMLGVMGASIIQFLDATIANVAVPHMQTSLGGNAETITWVLTSFIIALAVMTPLTGWLADRFGSRRMFLIAVGGFILASALCGLATNLPEMVAFRIFQGCCAALIGPLAQTVMLDINPPSLHARAMAIWGMAVMVAPITGPMLGGWLTESYSWRWVFYINLPIGIPTFLMLWWLLPTREIVRRRFDIQGYLYFAVAIGTFQLMLDRGQQLDWFSSFEIIFEGIIAASALWMFIIHLIGAKNPIYPAEMIRNRNFMTVLAFMLLMGLVMVSLSALLPPLLQRIYGYSVFDSGLLMAPRGIGVLITMFLATRLMPFTGGRFLIGFGFSVVAYSMWLMTFWAVEMGAREIVLTGLIQGLGLGFVFMPLNVMAFATLTLKLRTDGAALLNLTRNVGGSVGISIVTFMLARNIQISHNDLAGHISTQTLPNIDLSSTDRFGSAGDAMMTAIDAMVNQQAAMIAYLDDFWMIMWGVIFVIPLTFLLREPKVNPPAAFKQQR